MEPTNGDLCSRWSRRRRSRGAHARHRRNQHFGLSLRQPARAPRTALLAAEAVLIGPVSVGIFPANREKNREFRENRPSQSILKRLLSAVSMTCRQIPYEIEQGIFSAKQGIVSTEQGSGANEVSVHFSHACFGRPERDLFSPAFLQARRIEMVDGWRSRMCCGEAFWRAHHEAWRQSDLNQREYCEDRGIPLRPLATGGEVQSRTAAAGTQAAVSARRPKSYPWS
jgi:hypothetical protein